MRFLMLTGVNVARRPAVGIESISHAPNPVSVYGLTTV